MHAKRLESGWIEPFVEKSIELSQTIACGQAQRLCSQMNRDSLICDLYKRRILKKVLRKGRFCLNLIRESPIGRMLQNRLEITEIPRGNIQIHGELHGMTVERQERPISQGTLGPHPDIFPLKNKKLLH